MKPIDLIGSIWGEHYVGLFLDYCLSSLLSPNNIPALGKRGRLVIVTRPEDIEAVKAHPTFALVSKHVEIVTIAVSLNGCSDPFAERYGILAHYNRMGVRKSLDDGHMSAVLGCDALYADGYCAKLMEWADSGKRLVLGIGMRGALESMLPVLDRVKVDGVISIAPRDVVKIGLQNMHPIHQSAIWDAPYFTRMPYTFLFPVFGQGYVARSFCHHPYLLDPHDGMMNHHGNVDHDMPKYYDPEDIHYVTDSDEAVLCEFAPLTHFWPMGAPFKASPDIIARWASTEICPEQWDNLDQVVKIHSVDMDTARWDAVARTSDDAVGKINAAAGRKKKFSLVGDPGIEWLNFWAKPLKQG